MVAASLIEFTGENHLRHRLLLATLSGKPIRVTGIRANGQEHTGLLDYEASFLRLLEKVTNGCSIEINYTGTALIYRPGIILGGKVTHECPTSRAIGYFLEPMVALAPFAKNPITLTLTGITNDNVDMTVDAIRTVLCPQLSRFGVGEGLELKVTKRGAMPKGGGAITFHCPVLSALKPIELISPGKIKRIRGIAFATRTSPQMSNRVVDAARSLLTRYIPDVYIYTDVYRGGDSGLSPGYGCALVAESTTDCLVSAECTFQPKASGGGDEEGASTTASAATTVLQANYHFETPEDLGIRTARELLQAIRRGSCVDMACQWLYILYMALGPEDVSKVRFASLTPFSVQYLRDVKAILGVTFKITPDLDTDTLLLTCLGSGYSNINKKLK